MTAKVLFLDVETSPVTAHTWGIWQQDIAINQIVEDWTIISFAARWLGSKDWIYYDQRDEKDVRNDKALLGKLWKVLDQADVVVTQNGIKFDSKKIKARLIINGYPPPSPYKQIDTLQIAKKHFAFTSNRLEYMSNALNLDYKKSTHKEFPGFTLWSECLKGNKKAWRELERYNKQDVLALEELYKKLSSWDKCVNFEVYEDDSVAKCRCGSTQIYNRGFYYTGSGKYQRKQCKKCGAWYRDRKNLNKGKNKPGIVAV